ncbi:MAG: trigger factor [Thiohalomonadales bacterium]
MQVSIETTSGLERKLTVSLPEEKITAAVSSKLKELSRTTKLKGFRPGKVPIGVVQKRFGSQVRYEVVSDLVQSSFHEAISKEKVRPAGTPNITEHNDKPGEGVEYTATFEVYPEINPVSMEGAKINKTVVTISEANIDEMIETIQKQNQSWVIVEQAAKSKDQITIDYDGLINGESFEGGTGQAMAVEIGSNRMITGFEDGLIGLSAGDEKVLNLTFPENYHAKELANKAVEFKIKVISVAHVDLPAVDAEFAKKLGVADGNLGNMRVEVKDNMLLELSKKIHSELKASVMDKIIELNKLELPKALVDSESKALVQQMQSNLTQQGMKPDEMKLDPSMFTGQAERRVALGLILSEIVKQNDLKADLDSVKKAISKIAEPYDHPEEVVKWYYSDKNRLAEVESLVLEDKVVDWVMNLAEVSETTKSFKDVMQPKSDEIA